MPKEFSSAFTASTAAKRLALLTRPSRTSEVDGRRNSRGPTPRMDSDTRSRTSAPTAKTRITPADTQSQRAMSVPRFLKVIGACLPQTRGCHPGNTAPRYRERACCGGNVPNWLPSVKRRRGGRVVGLSSRVRVVAFPKCWCGVLGQSRWSQSRCPVALPGPPLGCR